MAVRHHPTSPTLSYSCMHRSCSVPFIRSGRRTHPARHRPGRRSRGRRFADAHRGEREEACRQTQPDARCCTQTRAVYEYTRCALPLLLPRSFTPKLMMTPPDTHVLPAELDQIFRRVQDSAHYMPNWQMESVMKESFGDNWFNPTHPDTVFLDFERVPFAAASIGQVHLARLAPKWVPEGLGGAPLL